MLPTICHKCNNTKLFTFTTKKIICAMCGNQFDYPKIVIKRGEFVDVWEMVEK